MAPNYLLVDFENIPSIDQSLLQANMKVMLFLGETSKIKADYLNKILKICNGMELIKINGSGHNAVDFHIAYFIGIYSEKEPAASFRILSKDTGYDPLIRYLASRGIKCERVEGANTVVKPKPVIKEDKKNDVDKIIKSIKLHFSNGGVKLRPKKASGFKAFVKSQGKHEDKTVKAIIEKMVSGKLIEITGDGITYHF